MERTTQLGLWVDYGQAILIGYAEGEVREFDRITSSLGKGRREEGEGNDSTRFTPNHEHASNNEYRKHQTEQQVISEYLKQLEQELLRYKEVLIFGPGTAKEQLRNRLKDNKAFRSTWVAVENADKMTQNQLMAFVRDFFRKNEPV
ncbi:hypothetical protein [Lunatimonas sp.]|uniref:hypothetical protein n=1 Tax=Lunatimonas sp. TaxID=2060141 RepID=UPI00263BC244|nr:hypothetical protein [Lunatimonas sp.]